MKQYDFLVIGSGIAGLIYALETSRLGRVAVISKETLNSCNTEYAQGGIAAVISQQDSFEQHALDTFAAGAELGKLNVIRTIVEEGPKVIDYLIKQGTNFTQKDKSRILNLENLSLTKEGAHSFERVAYAADSTGHEIMQALTTQVKSNNNIDIYENHTAIDIITQHHIPQKDCFIPRITCWGAYVMNNETGEVTTFKARKTMLATGGGGQTYLNTTNPAVATGDGYAMARLAGARLANMEFVQFHPTAFFTYSGKTFLVSEALRGEGAILRLQDGSKFMHRYHKLGSLAPRDVVSRAITTEMNRRGDKYVLLDATGVDKARLQEHFPYIDRKCRQYGVDFTKDPIPVVPAAHYFCGGIVTTIDGRTDIKNLFAAGEVACTGLHGANRLASNSLLEAAVIAFRASKHPSNLDEIDFPEIPEWQEENDFNEYEWVIISHNRAIIKTIMQGYVGIIRSRRLLKYAKDRINNIYNEINNFYQHNPVRREVIETRNMAVVAAAIIESALRRKESRGLHYITDYPNYDDKHFKKDTII